MLAIAGLMSGCALDGSDDELSTTIIDQELLTASRGDDIVVLGSNAPGSGIVTAFSNDDSTFQVITTLSVFNEWAKGPTVKRLSGDFNHDGRMDLALVGGVGWNTLPTAFSNGDGTYLVTNAFVGSSFNDWARGTNVRALVGDYNKDGYSDIALTGFAGWATIPVAFSAGGGQYQITNYTSGVAGYASRSGAQPLVGDFNKDGYSDIAVVRIGEPFAPISFAAGGGSWQVTVQFTGPFDAWASTPGVKPLVGDYNRDGYSDIALTGAAGWGSIPVAFASGGGSFWVTNSNVPDFASWASAPNATPLAGDFNRDGYTDIALVGGPGWLTVPVALSRSGGAFEIWNNAVGTFGTLANLPGVFPIAGDYNADGATDIALGGPASSGSLPIAFSSGWGAWSTTNSPVTLVPELSGEQGVTIAVGRSN
jgi:hypothetical protein